MAKKARVLVAGFIGGIHYKPNDVVSIPDALAKQHAEAVDTDKEAVAYALSINGGQVIEHQSPAVEEPAAPAAEPPPAPAQ